MSKINLEKITEFTASSTSQLIDLDHSLQYLEESQFIIWAFRGQPQTYGNLKPSFQREFGEQRSVPTARIVEDELMSAFRNHYKKLKEKSPNMPDSSVIDNNYDLRCLSVMQHYEVPTRLLDWTSNFWTAIFFACSGYPENDAELWFYDRNIFEDQDQWLSGLGSLRDISNHGLVPLPEPVILSKEMTNLIFELDLELTPRMQTQKAHHTISTDIFEDHATLIINEAQKKFEGNTDKKGIRRIIIDKGCKEKTLRFLDEQKNVTASTIFPDVEGLGRFLRWQLDSLLTTLL